MHSSDVRSQRVFSAYGKVLIEKQFCRPCGGWAFVLEGFMACCDRPAREHGEKIFKRECEHIDKRVLPPKTERVRLLREQNFKCFWCDIPLDQHVMVVYKNWACGQNSKIRPVKIHWDHIQPYSYTRNNRVENFAASCNFCNLFKHAAIYETIEEGKQELKRKWLRKVKRLIPSSVVLFAEPNLFGIVNGQNIVEGNASNEPT